mgnify:CR=1 FL=1
MLSFFFQAEDGIRDRLVTGVQTCALPISLITLTICYRRGLSPSNILKASTASISLAFKRMLDAKGYVPDEHQDTALVHFDRLAHELAGSDFLGADGPLTRIQRLLRLTSRKSPAGIYLWGKVGRGKTMMMDVLFDTVPGKRKRRVHFHRFKIGRASCRERV